MLESFWFNPGLMYNSIWRDDVTFDVLADEYNEQPGKKIRL